MIKTGVFDAAKYLEDEEDIALFPQAATEEAAEAGFQRCRRFARESVPLAHTKGEAALRNHC